MCRRRLVGRLAFFDAWRQVIEVVLIACPMEVLNASQRLALLFDLLQDLLLKVKLIYCWLLYFCTWPLMTGFVYFEKTW